MKKIGLLGGMSYVSTSHYYEQINQRVNERVGGDTTANLVVRSVNFEKYRQLMKRGEWEKIGDCLGYEASGLSSYMECEYIAVATNTMHKVADAIAQHCPKSTFVHIGDCIAEACERTDAMRILLLGTKFTMEEDFMKDFLANKYGIETIDTSPYPNEVEEINRIIFDELCNGAVTESSKRFLAEFVRLFFVSNANPKPDAVVLGCTELNMLLNGDSYYPIIDSTEEHVRKLVELSLS